MKVEVYDPCKKEEPTTHLRLSNRGADLGVRLETVDAKGTAQLMLGIFTRGSGFTRTWMNKSEADAVGMPTERHPMYDWLYAVKVN